MKDYTRLIFETDCSKEEFDAFAENHPNGSLLQESRWAEVKSNWDSCRVVLRSENEIVAAAQILIRRIGLGFSLFYIPRGPLLDWSDEKLCAVFFERLKKFGHERKAAFIKIDPLVIDSRVSADGETEDDLGSEAIEILKNYGWIHHGKTMRFEDTVQPRSQAVVYLGTNRKKDKKLKYYLNHAKKKGVQVMRMKADGAELFAKLEEKTADRKNIALRSQEYFEHMMKVYGEDANISIAYINIDDSLKNENERLVSLNTQLENPQYKEAKKAEIREQIASVEKSISVLSEMKEKYGNTAYISGALIIRSGRYSELLYAGMDEELGIYRSNNSFQDAIDWAEENGCKYCNLGGVEGTLDDSLAGYKKLYGPDFESYIGEFDLPVYAPVYYAVSRLIPAVRKFHTVLAKRSKQ